MTKTLQTTTDRRNNKITPPRSSGSEYLFMNRFVQCHHALHVGGVVAAARALVRGHACRVVLTYKNRHKIMNTEIQKLKNISIKSKQIELNTEQKNIRYS